jgi:hypothetical protein
MGVMVRCAARIGGRRGGVAVPLVTAMLAAATARAGESAAAGSTDPAAPHALGRVFTAGPTSPALFLISSGGYGYTESVLNAGDTHHRAAGALAIEGRPASWFGLGLRLDGRYDRHEAAGQGTDDGWIGDPRVFARVDGGLGPTLRAGGRLGIWLPGRSAPSVALAAITPEAGGALTLAPRGFPLWLSANGGYRLNRSTRAATDAAMLSTSDRLGLEMSAYDQVLMGLGAAYGAGRAQGFAEFSAELMVGAGSPPLSSSPMRAGAGMRFALTTNVRLEGQAEVAVGSRPTLSMSGPLVPVLPRAAVWMGVAYRFGSDAATAPRAHPAPSPEVVAAPAAVKLEGRVVTADGAPLTEAQVTVALGGRAPEAVAVDDDGRFTFSGKAGQTLAIEARAAGHDAASGTVTLAAGSPAALTLTLPRRLPGGQIRGLVRSFRGAGVDAEITIDAGEQTPAAPRTLRTQDGRFEVDVAPGKYEVTITAPGYETQRRRVEVEQNGVTLLNADLRSER